MQSEENHNNLKGLREDKGLSIESVASTLKLNTDVIKKLEESDFNNLGAYTYVRGYLNHYASLLGVDAQKYIDLIPKSNLEVPFVNTSSNNSKSFKLRKHSKSVFNYAIGTFIVIAVSFSGYYLLKTYSSTNNKSIEIVKSDSLEILPQSQTSISNDQISEDVSEETFHYSSLIPTNVTNDKGLNGDEIQLPEQNKEINEKQVEGDLTLTSTDLLSADLLITDKEVPLKAYNIIIDATETSWVKVENLDGNKLHNDLLKPGSISLSSDKPLHFRIGNEKKIKVTINGEEIDLSIYSSKDIADFNWPLES